MRSAALTYILGRSVYVPLTSRSNALSLPETRGPGFMLPAEVVASLCRVRDKEHDQKQWVHWCQYLDTQENPQRMPPPLELVRALPLLHTASHSTLTGGEEDGRYPLLSTLLDEIHCSIGKDKKRPEAVVIAGEGEPTLRLDGLLMLSRACSSFAGDDITVRVTTNGLVASPKICATELKSNGVSAVSVALMTADPLQYDDLMQPLPLLSEHDSDCEVSVSAHARVCDFIREAVAVDLQVEVTGIDRPEVNKEETNRLVISLGVEAPCRWRPYFP